MNAASGSTPVRNVGVLLLFGAALASPWLSWRPVGPFLATDLLLLAAIGIALPSTVARNGLQAFRPYVLLFFFVGLASFGGLLGALVRGTDSIDWVRFASATIAATIAVAVCAPSDRQITIGAALVGLGTAISGVAGFRYGLIAPGDRLYGLSAHPVHLGIVAGMTVLPTMSMCRLVERRIFAVAWAVCAVMLVLVVLRTGSRSGLLVMVVAVVVFLTSRRSTERLLRLSAVVIPVGGLIFIVGMHPSRFSSVSRLLGGGGSTVSDTNRTEKLRDSWNAVAVDPLIGNGFDGVQNAHSVPLQLWQGAGLLGLTSFLVLAVAILRLPSWRGRWRPIGSLHASLIGFLAVSFVSNQLWDRYIWIPLALGFAQTANRRRSDRPLADSGRNTEPDVHQSVAPAGSGPRRLHSGAARQADVAPGTT